MDVCNIVWNCRIQAMKRKEKKLKSWKESGDSRQIGKKGTKKEIKSKRGKIMTIGRSERKKWNNELKRKGRKVDEKDKGRKHRDRKKKREKQAKENKIGLEKQKRRKYIILIEKKTSSQ